MNVIIIQLDPNAGNTVEEDIADLQSLGFTNIKVAEGHVAERILESLVIEGKEAKS